MNDERDKPEWYPNTYVPIKDALEVFDPALRHFIRGKRAGEPQFKSIEQRTLWIQARRSVVDRVLTVIHASPWHDRLVMRGSYLLRSWVGDEAREPGDLDFVFSPSNVAHDSAEADQLLLKLTQRVAEVADASDPAVNVNAIATDEIWTYSRSAGRRIVFPFHAEGLPDGYVQVDIVFGEELPDEPVLLDVPLSTGESLPFLTASKALSLAWKLLWLQSDSYPQGKDLYDAVLIARLTDLPWSLLDRVLSQAGEAAWSDAVIDTFMVDWDNFLLEHPDVGGTEDSWKRQLADTLRITGRKEFVGKFETHFTVSFLFQPPEKVEALHVWAKAHSMKFTHIVLEGGGLNGSQPMVTRYGSGTLSQQLAEADRIKRELESARLDVCRVKIEASVENADVPRTKDEARPGMYFEHHIKLLLPKDFDPAKLAPFTEPHGARLSQNARRVRDDGLIERFLTQRRRRCGLHEAQKSLDDLLTAIPPAYKVLEVEQEYVVYDTNDRIDSDWMARRR